jgi:hypothetical protein
VAPGLSANRSCDANYVLIVPVYGLFPRAGPNAPDAQAPWGVNTLSTFRRAEAHKVTEDFLS